MAEEDLSRLKIDKSAAIERPAKRRRYGYLMAAVLFAVLFVLLYSKGILSPSVEVEVANVVRIYPSQSFTLLNASGYVVAQRKAAVASKSTGRLEWIGVEEGSRVKSGQVIARLEGEDTLAAKRQAEANLENARFMLEQAKAQFEVAGLTYNRKKELLKQELVPQADFDAADANYKGAKASYSGSQSAVNAAKAAFDAAGIAVEYTFIRAPFDAVVLTKNADVGDIITPLGAAANAKAAVVTIADMSSLQVEADVSESNLEKVKTGQPCEIQLDAFPEMRFRGNVHMIVPTADRTKASVLVKIKFLDIDSRILPEMSAKVAFLQRPAGPEEQKPLTAINPAAVIEKNGKKYVFLIKDKTAYETQITTGKQIGDVVEVTSGISAGDKVVLKPLNKIKNNTKIKTAEPS
jgi:RND family efflux transporter MFP subunit